VLRVVFTIVQLSDPHLGAPWDVDPGARLAAALDAVRRTLPTGPDAVIVTGDIASTPTADEYEQARRLLDPLPAPVYLLAGNHDDRELLRRHFDLPASDAELLSYVAEHGPVRVVMLDTQDPGQDGGRLDRPRLEWLERVLAADTDTPTLLAMHHPPIATGVPAMDPIGIPSGQRRELEDVLAGHRQVQLIVAGHVHRIVVGALGGVPVLTIPSTSLQLALDFDADELRFVDEPPSFAVHRLVAGRLVSHLQPIRTWPGGD
jgi:3',5'-cyclic AMP phosphodiesterase CpdA